MDRIPLLRVGTHALWVLALLSLPFDARAYVPGGSLDPTTIPKFEVPLVVPPPMPQAKKPHGHKHKKDWRGPFDYYEIAMRQFRQQILPPGLPATTVWGYGSPAHPETFHAPSFTIEARTGRPVRVKWINQLTDGEGHFLPHLLPVDQTLHWANPPRDCAIGDARSDCTGRSQEPYDGPVPIVTHVHGAHVGPESDGYPEAWYLPAAVDIPDDYARRGARWDQFLGGKPEAGAATFQYPNDQRASTLWYHDHALGMTRLNVYAGPAGFYLLRGGRSDLPDFLLPGPAAREGDKPGKRYREIPIAIQDRSFNEDGSLFYPDHRAFFEGLEPGDLEIPFRWEEAVGGPSDVAKVWNPEFFGNTMMVNGRTWPYLEVDQSRYRFRFLNGSQSRFLILATDRPGLTLWQIGNEGGFLDEPVPQAELLMGPAERADVIVDFSGVPAGTVITLLNLGPDEPFGGGLPGVDFEPSDPLTTGQVMQFRVVPRDWHAFDLSVPPDRLRLPRARDLGPESVVRQVTLNELDSGTVPVTTTEEGKVVMDPSGEPFGPVAAMLGILASDGTGIPLPWDAGVTENPVRGATEVWEIHNLTVDAHPIHLHQVMFEVVDRESLAIPGLKRPQEAWEGGLKDTVIAYPGEITRVRATFDIAGLYVWHCHILEHEDNEMMRPYCVGDLARDCRISAWTGEPVGIVYPEVGGQERESGDDEGEAPESEDDKLQR